MMRFLFRRLIPFFWPFFAASARELEDPNPPRTFEAPEPATDVEPGDFDRLTFHRAPKPLPAGALVADWPRFLGPNHDGTTGETKLLDAFPEEGLTMVWEIAKGSGYTSPVITGDRLVMFDRFGDEETIECFHPETGKRFWRYAYPVEYRDRYGYRDGPRASAVIDSGRVYTLGVRCVLTCLDLWTGALLWQRDLDADFEVAPCFFGFGSCPLVYKGKVIVHLGGAGGLCVAAFDQDTGRLVWGTEQEWGSSYASPVVFTFRGKPRLLVFAGGESRPPSGGLLAIDPDTGHLFDAFPWRADKYESVNASCPVRVGENRVFISEAYENGGVLLELDENLKWREIWRAPAFGHHWATPVLHEGHLYGFPGRNEPDATVACLNVETGQIAWSHDYGGFVERKTLPSGRTAVSGMFRGSILKAEGRLYALGELGTLAILDPNPERFRYLDKTELFYARSTWSLPVVSRGLLYVSQHEPDEITGEGPRLICYDFRADE